ncbi:MAG: hypothetical protein V4622_12985 [Bacteroidota bacterium]
MKQLFYLTFILFLLQSCAVNKKLRYQVTANIVYPSSSSITNSVGNAKYLDGSSSSLSTFMSEFNSTISDNNVLVSHDSLGKADYLIRIQRLNVIESISTTTVNDVNSPDNGRKFDIHSCEVSVEYSVINNFTGVEIKSKETGVLDEEKLSNRRTFFEVLFGLNKNNSNYHVKEMSSSVFDRLSRKAARRVSAKVTRSIKNDIK